MDGSKKVHRTGGSDRAARGRVDVIPPLAPPDQPDLTIDAATRRAVVDTVSERIERRYVFRDKAAATARALRKRLAAHEYDRITSAKEFADSLTSHARAVTHDLHLRVAYRP